MTNEQIKIENETIDTILHGDPIANADYFETASIRQPGRRERMAQPAYDTRYTGDCKHTKTREINVTPYFGPVADNVDDQNPKAHGNITVSVECVECGAWRRVNVNQGHREFGAWQKPTR